MKKYLIFFVLIFTVILIGFNISNYTEADSLTFHFNGKVNEFAMEKLPEVIKDSTKEKFNNNYDVIKDGSKSQVQMRSKKTIIYKFMQKQRIL
ncbi:MULTISPECIES: hypothetical protein [Mesobacillus]|uniref:Uncharacterized protein n=2 Tax=Mesobacillus TaxID=2675231 RepID=A0A0D6ZD49_9BACI|nr:MULTISPECIES: hypothetical protein [Mesobacillus]KIY22508.1 hypothetical protein UB32_08215 [Mesobacillus subterraneus]MDQ0413922.1 hypothetical protein [Mesobacillus stamsii]